MPRNEEEKNPLDGLFSPLLQIMEMGMLCKVLAFPEEEQKLPAMTEEEKTVLLERFTMWSDLQKQEFIEKQKQERLEAEARQNAYLAELELRAKSKGNN